MYPQDGGPVLFLPSDSMVAPEGPSALHVLNESLVLVRVTLGFLYAETS